MVNAEDLRSPPGASGWCGRELVPGPYFASRRLMNWLCQARRLVLSRSLACLTGLHGELQYKIRRRFTARPSPCSVPPSPIGCESGNGRNGPRVID
jgi:hypothetical protein